MKLSTVGELISELNKYNKALPLNICSNIDSSDKNLYSVGSITQVKPVRSVPSDPVETLEGVPIRLVTIFVGEPQH